MHLTIYYPQIHILFDRACLKHNVLGDGILDKYGVFNATSGVDAILQIQVQLNSYRRIVIVSRIRIHRLKTSLNLSLKKYHTCNRRDIRIQLSFMREDYENIIYFVYNRNRILR